MGLIIWDKKISIGSDRRKEINDAVREIWQDVVKEAPVCGLIDDINMADFCPNIIIKDDFYDLKKELPAACASDLEGDIREKVLDYQELVNIYKKDNGNPEEILDAIDDIFKGDFSSLSDSDLEAFSAGYGKMKNIYSTYIPLKAELNSKDMPDKDEVKSILSENKYEGHEIHIYYRQFIKSVNAYKLLKAALAQELFKAMHCLISFIVYGNSADNVFYEGSNKPHQLVNVNEREAIYEALASYYACCWCKNQKEEGYKFIAENLHRYLEKHLIFDRKKWQKNAVELISVPSFTRSAAVLIESPDQAAQILDATINGGPGGNLYHARFLLLIVPKE